MIKIIFFATLVILAKSSFLVRNPLLEVQIKNLTTSKIGTISTVNYDNAVSSVESLLKKQEAAFDLTTTEFMKKVKADRGFAKDRKL